jgi:hypothetical protein
MISGCPLSFVELLRRYSNREDLTKSVQNVLRRIAECDKTDEPGIFRGSEPRHAQRRLSKDAQRVLIDSFRRGATVRVLAEGYGVSESYVKTTLWRNGVGRSDRHRGLSVSDAT